MKSPFPGMDPYLERHWRDVHSSLVIYARDQMQEFLPEELFARVEERVYVENPGNDDRSIYPDVRVVEHRPGTQSTVAVADEIEIAESFLVTTQDEPVTETYIEIREIGSGHRVVTVIEFLSPANKVAGPGQEQYRQKQAELCQGGVSLVEIDLVRTGRAPNDVVFPSIPAELRTPYMARVRRSWEPLRIQCYRLPLRARLGAIMVPLRRCDREIPLRLQQLVDQCYRNGRYHTLDYQAEPEPPLSPDDARWADELLRGAGKRV
jgi:hypothetical protein